MHFETHKSDIHTNVKILFYSVSFFVRLATPLVQRLIDVFFVFFAFRQVICLLTFSF